VAEYKKNAIPYMRVTEKGNTHLSCIQVATGTQGRSPSGCFNVHLDAVDNPTQEYSPDLPFDIITDKRISLLGNSFLMWDRRKKLIWQGSIIETA
jgi:hypothetical protein